MIKQFKYRGHSLEELKKMDLSEFAQIVNSRAKRNLLRNQNNPFYQKFEEGKKLNKKIRTHKRDLIVTPKMIGHKIFIYNGKNFAPVEITKDMLGHYLGEFKMTRKKVKHGKAGIGATRSSTAITTRK